MRQFCKLAMMTVLPLMLAATSWAQFAIAPGSVGIIDHGTYAVGAAGGGPAFDPNGFMTNPGGGYPTVGATNSLNSVGPAGINPPGLNLATAPAPGPPAFGGARTTMSARGGGRAGLWWSRNWVRDNPANEGFGSYNISGGDVTFNNVSGFNIFGRAGVYMPFTGFINQAGAGGNAYLASSLLARFTIRNGGGGVVQDFFLGSLLRTDGTGPRVDQVLLDGATVAGAYNPIGFQTYVANVVGQSTTFQGYGIALQNVLIPAGGSLTVLGRWTLLADPESGVDYEDLYGNDPTVLANMPDFGYNPVPEPATMTALGLGLVALIRKRRAKKA